MVPFNHLLADLKRLRLWSLYLLSCSDVCRIATTEIFSRYSHKPLGHSWIFRGRVGGEGEEGSSLYLWSLPSLLFLNFTFIQFIRRMVPRWRFRRHLSSREGYTLRLLPAAMTSMTIIALQLPRATRGEPSRARSTKSDVLLQRSLEAAPILPAGDFEFQGCWYTLFHDCYQHR